MLRGLLAYSNRFDESYTMPVWICPLLQLCYKELNYLKLVRINSHKCNSSFFNYIYDIWDLLVLVTELATKY